MLFWNRQQSDSADSRELEQLEQQLRQVGKIELAVKQKEALKRQLFTALQEQQQGKEELLLPQNLRVLRSSIREIGEKAMLSIPQQVKMKDRIFSFIQKTNWLGLAFSPFRNARFWKVAISSSMLLFFVVTSVFIFPFQVPLTYAAHLTYIDDVSGQVYVLRSGQMLQAKKDFALQEGDILVTKADSYVTVRFFDDSVSRLDANTQLEVKRLYSEPFNPVATQVELLLQDGHIWTNVLNLVDDDSHFMISTENSSAIVTKKAAFDLQTHVYDTTLSVFDNVVDFAFNNNSTETHPVLAGFQAEVSQENGANITKIVPVAPGLQQNKVVAQWVESNLQKDQIHTAVLAQENQQNLEDKTGLTDTLQAPAPSDSNAVLNNPQLEQERQHFLDSYQRLLLGETYLMRQQGRDGMSLILEFESTVRSIMIHYPDDQSQDPLNANLLFSFMQSKIEQQRKDLATLLPGDPLYPAKEELENSELYLAGSDVDKAQMQLSQSADKLLEVQDLISKAQFDEANAVLVRYQRQIDSLVLKMNSSDVSELQDKLVSLFDQQIEQMKELTAIEKSLLSTQTDLLQEVRSLRQEILEKLLAAMEKMNSDLPLSLIQELRDLLQTYIVNGGYDQTFVNLLNKMLLKYDASADSNSKLPSELGVVTIVEEDATPPVQGKATQETIQSSTQQTQQQTQQSGPKKPSSKCGTQQCS